MNNIELWFHRIAIVLLLIGMVIVMQGNKQAQYMGLKNIELINQNTEDIHGTLLLVKEIINKMPDKK